MPIPFLIETSTARSVAFSRTECKSAKLSKRPRDDDKKLLGNGRSLQKL